MTALDVPASRTLSANMRGVIFMVTAMVLFGINDACMKLLAERLPLSQLMTVRGLLALPLMVGLAIATGATRQLPRVFSGKVLLRGLLDAGGAILYIGAIAGIGLGEIVAILQTTPLLITALSGPLLGEKVGWRRWTAVIVGFVGVLLIVRPTPSAMNLSALLALASTLFVVGRDLMTRTIPSTVSTSVISIGAIIAMTACGLAIAPSQTWLAITINEWMLLGVSAAFVSGGIYFIVNAFRIGDVSVVSPFRYTIVPLALLLGFLIWGTVPDAISLFGTALVVMSGLYALHREAVRRETKESAAG